MSKPLPPRWATRLLRWFCAPHLLDELEGDLDELFRERVQTVGLNEARRRYGRDVLGILARPFAWKRQSNPYAQPSFLNPIMLRNYLKIALRNLVKNRAYSFINISGLAVGMAVAMLIGLWVWDELSYNTYHQNYDRIAQVMQHQTFGNEVGTQVAVPHLMAQELRDKYGSDFRYALQSTWIGGHILAHGATRLPKTGNYIEPQAPDMLSLKMLRGTRSGLGEPYSILLSESVAKAFFGEADPLGKIMRVDNKSDVKVTGVYEDLPYNSSFREMTFMLPWALFLSENNDWLKARNPWRGNFTQTFVQLADHANMDNVSAKIRNVRLNNMGQDAPKQLNPQVFLHPMSKWHLYSDWENGVNTGGRIQYVWLFGIIGAFVLLLACINFMNLATARSEKRAREVGIRKAIGSFRSQLISQFFSESLLVVAVAFVLAVLLVQLILPFFNQLADKKMSILWLNPVFWLLGIGFSLFTGLVAGSYPALYLSSFQPIKVLKGTFRVGRFAAIPRQVLVVVQFTVSVTLIIGTLVVYRQIQHAKNRPVGYTRDGLVMVYVGTPDIHEHFEAVRNDLKGMGAIVEMAESTSPITEVWNSGGGFDWKGKDPNLTVGFPNSGVTHEYGKTVGWQFKQGRDFSRAFSTDSSALVVNEAAVKFMGLQHPVGEIIKLNGKPYTIVGVIADMVVNSPFQPIEPFFFRISDKQESVILLKLHPSRPARESLGKIDAVFKKHAPALVFEYRFVDDEYARKFGDEERVGTLSGFFATLAVLISCLGLFGLASFMAEQRTKEIGVRKVLGASVLNLWGLLSKEFVSPVLIAFGIATPLAYYFLSGWLQKYTYRTELSWWIFAATGVGALAITLLTVSYQSIKAALVNPVKSLRSE